MRTSDLFAGRRSTEGFCEVDLTEVVDLAVRDLTEGSPRGKQCRIEIEPLPTVVARQTELARLFQNLISNAIKFCPPERTPHITVRCTRQRLGWQFCVEDNGVGIPEGEQEAAFVAFKRLHGREFEGCGIGLAAAQKAVRQHGGQIWIERREDESGTRVYFSLPEAEQKEDEYNLAC